MGTPNLIPIPRYDDSKGIIRAIQKLASLRLNADSKPAFLGNALEGTANQVIVTVNDDNSVTLSLPQDVDTDADVEFDSIVLRDSDGDIIMSSNLVSFYITSLTPPAAIVAGNPIGLLLALTYSS